MTVPQEQTSAAKILAQLGFWYFVLALAGMLMTRSEHHVGILWYANAVSIAFMCGQGFRRRMQILAVSMLADVTANLVLGSDLLRTSLFSIANAVEILLVSYTIHSAKLAQGFEQSSSRLLKLIILGFFIPCACSATLAAALGSWGEIGDFAPIFTTWYVGSSLGLTLIFPLLRLMQRAQPRSWPSGIQWPRLLSYAIPLVCLVVFLLLYLPFPLLYILVALTFATQKFEYEETHILVTLAVTCLTVMISQNLFQPINVATGWQMLFMFMPIMFTAIPPLLLAASLNESRLKERERQRVAQDLAHSQANLQATIDHVPAMISYCDAGLRLRFANEAYLRWFKTSAKAIQGKPVREVIGEQIYQLNLPFIESALRGEAQLFERTVTDREGDTRYVLASYIPQINDGIVHGVYAFITDISALKQAQLQELRTQAKLKSIFEAANDFAIISTDLQGTIQLFSHGAEKMLGYSEAEMVGAHSPDIIHLAQEIEARGLALTEELGYQVDGFEVFAAKARMGVSQAHQWTYVTKQGQHIPVTLVISAVHNEANEISGFLGIATDISRQKQLEASLISAKELAEMASRTKSEFLANMSHEIRTPMNAVLGMSYLLGKTELNAVQRNYLEMIRSSGQSLLGILNDILDISKIEAGRIELSPSRFFLKDILNALANMMSVNVGEKQLELSMGIDAEVPRELIGDALRLQQVLINIIGNAIKFTERGEVSLLVQQAGQTEKGLLVQFIVRDTGIGMTQEQISRLFTAFEQADASTSRRFGGTGLGLVISKRFIDLMGGSITVSSQAGAGTEFIVTIPLKVAQALSGSPQEPAFPAGLAGIAGAQNKKILVVDDNATSRSYIAKTIRAWGWQADTAESGKTAIQKVREQLEQDSTSGGNYCAILIDWHMPGEDGMTILSTIRSLLEKYTQPSLPLILMSSAYDRSALNLDGKPDAPDAVLLKPVSGSSLYDVLQETSMQVQARTPQTQAGQASSNSSSNIISNGSFAGNHILLVEDNYFNQIVATKILEQTGALVTLANNGSEAVELLKLPDSQFDLVLMDVQMPIMDGWTATEILRKELALPIPILAMTAGVMTAERERCLLAGMNEVISKPIDIDQMLAMLARYLPQEGTDKKLPAVAADHPPSVEAGPQPETAFSPVPPTGEPQVELQAETRPPRETASPAQGVFDPTKLMALAKGNPALLKTLSGVIQNMIAHAREDFDKARSNWQENEMQLAARGLHTMRGSIGTLGASNFAQATLALETAIKNAEQDRIPALFEQADQQLNLTIDSVRQWLQATTASNVQEAAVSPEQALLDAGKITEFKDLLRAQNMKASAVYQHVRQSLFYNWSQEQQDVFHQMMLSLDFDAALATLENSSKPV